ncbi:MAG: M50 family metallopeptidase, partial [Planctomycetes bacterium]|nr:M50 family metallopeptidase [Planctomycetota bacterium]
MFSTRWQLFRVFGIPIRLDMSWLIILCLLTWTFASQVFASNLPNLGKPELWGLGLITAVAFFLCILLHELGHALVARPLGIPINGITLFLFGGVAEMAGEPLSPGGEFLMAVAGPLVSLVLGVVFLMLGAVGEKVHWGEPVILVL